ncbi:hypothetical protein H072_2694 [Dactylellina haptotyla CBS 200.50]|uniref:Uncharacterized protein n=1 Tax=Dactylellina haptotyla (strain CBS 200.50) TaxID=1284197 RepID=S8BV38_DACHA|nr:hypothetical protein H072_2694 [Dactylellina haptotyla CBS 200.50]
MSASQPTGAPAVEKDRSKRRSIQRFVSKLIKPKSKKHESSETGVVSGPSTSSAAATTVVVASTSTPVPAPVPVSEPEPVAEPAAAPKETAPTPIDPPESAPTAGDESKEDPEIGVKLKSTAAKFPTLSHGARQLAEKHGIEIPEDWPYAPKAPVGKRVQKPIQHLLEVIRVAPTVAIKDVLIALGLHLLRRRRSLRPSIRNTILMRVSLFPGEMADKIWSIEEFGNEFITNATSVKPTLLVREHVHSVTTTGARNAIENQAASRNLFKRLGARNQSNGPVAIVANSLTLLEIAQIQNVLIHDVWIVPKKKKKKAVLPLEIASAAETKEEPTAGPSDIDKVSNALAATTIS